MDQTVFGQHLSAAPTSIDGDERRTFARIIGLSATIGDTSLLIAAMTELLQKWSGCDAVGIRLKKGEDYPYIETRGFTDDFVAAESRLCRYPADGRTVHRDGLGNPVLECMCGNVIQGRFNPKLPFFTARGSFWTNSTTQLLATTSDADRQSRTRNRCNGEGYESVALIPLGVGGHNFGLMQFNDRRPDRFSPDLIALLELLADSVAVVLEHRRMQQALDEKERALRAMIDSANEPMVLLDPRGRVIEINAAEAANLGLSVQSIRGRSIFEILPPGVSELRRAKFRQAVSTGLQIQFEDVRDGKYFESHLHPITGPSGEVAAVAVYARDITSYFQIVSELTRSEAKLSLQNRLAGLFLTAEGDRLYSEVLKEILKSLKSPYGIFGYLNTEGDLVIPSLTDAVWDECRMPDKTCVFLRDQWGGLWGTALKEKRAVFLNGGLRTPPGHIPLKGALSVPIIHRDELVGLFTVANKEGGYDDSDLHILETMAGWVAPVLKSKLDKARHEEQQRRMKAEQQRLETQLQQAQKMEAIGTLAGGIAHDFNNILFPIIGFAEMLQEQAPAQSAVQEGVNEILVAANRARELVHQILAFSHQAEHERKPLRIQSILKEVLKLVRSILPTTIAIHAQIDGNCGNVLGDATQIHQVVMNLVTNAYHAMQARGGTLTVALAEVALSGADAARADIPPGRYAHLTVADTGCGMSPEVLARIFEPYFSTKGKDKGTGLGLSVALGIVKGMAGAILADSAPDQGARFDVYLPVIGRDATAEIKVAAAGPLPRGSERILLVDDEEAIVRMMVARLERLGYQVTPYTSSTIALAQFSANPQYFDLVITDLTMPHMAGDELALRILSLSTQTPVIVCTGFSERITPEEARAMGIAAFIMKPVVATELATTIRRVVDEKKMKA